MRTRISRRWLTLGAAAYCTVTAGLAPGHARAAPPPSVSLSSPSQGASYPYGQRVAFSAVVNGGNATPTGVVDFEDRGSNFASATLTPIPNTTMAKASTSVALAGGGHAIVASFRAHGVTSAPAANITISPSPTTLTIVSSRNPVASGQPATFTATVSSSRSACPVGWVVFSDEGGGLGTGSLGDPGPCQARLSTSSLSPGGHSITASYRGDGNFAASDNGASPYIQQVLTSASPPAPTAAAAPGTPGAPPAGTGAAGGPLVVSGPSASTAGPSASAIGLVAPPSATPPVDRPFGSAPDAPLPPSVLDTSVVPPIAVLSMVGGIRMGSAPQIFIFLLILNGLVLVGIYVASRRGRDLTRRSLGADS